MLMQHHVCTKNVMSLGNYFSHTSNRIGCFSAGGRLEDVHLKNHDWRESLAQTEMREARALAPRMLKKTLPKTDAGRVRPAWDCWAQKQKATYVQKLLEESSH